MGHICSWLCANLKVKTEITTFLKKKVAHKMMQVKCVAELAT